MSENATTDDRTGDERLNLVTFETDGRAKQPVAWYDDIDVELPIADDSAVPASSG